MSNTISVIDWIKIALRPDIFHRSIKVALVVGTLLAAINHGDKLIAANMDIVSALKIFLTYLVPFGVATWSAVQLARTESTAD